MPELEVCMNLQESITACVLNFACIRRHDMYYVMSQIKRPKKNGLVLAASRLINDLMRFPTNRCMKENHSLRHKPFQVDFLSTLSGDFVSLLFYHRQLGEQWIQDAKALSC